MNKNILDKLHGFFDYILIVLSWLEEEHASARTQT